MNQTIRLLLTVYEKSVQTHEAEIFYFSLILNLLILKQTARLVLLLPALLLHDWSTIVTLCSICLLICESFNIHKVDGIMLALICWIIFAWTEKHDYVIHKCHTYIHVIIYYTTKLWIWNNPAFQRNKRNVFFLEMKCFRTLKYKKKNVISYYKRWLRNMWKLKKRTENCINTCRFPPFYSFKHIFIMYKTL